MMLRADLLAVLPGVRHGFFTREGGVSQGPWATLNVGLRNGDLPESVAENRARAAVALRLRPEQLVTARQVHGVTALVVAEAARGQGIGRALMAAAETWAVERGCVLLEVTSNRRRVDAHAFYERLGYEATSFRFAKALSPT